MADIEYDLDEEVESLLTFEPENDSGCVEYKRSLINKDRDRMLELETQMRYRMTQGDGQCFYLIGVDDDGSPCGLTEEEYKETRQNLEKLASKCDYSIRLLSQTTCKQKCKHVYEFLIKENNLIDYEEVKIGIAGSVDAGKSTLVGVLISGDPDNGRGSARLKVLNFKHEVQSGRTSSVAQQILGYDPEGNIVNHDTTIKRISWPEISKRSSKIISFFDLCGHESYTKTTLKGLMGNSIDYTIVVIGANKTQLEGTTMEHIDICGALRIPVIILLTKVDMTDEIITEQTIDTIKRRLSHSSRRRLIYEVKSISDVVTISQSMTGDVVPIFRVSNTKYTGIDLVHEFLNMVRPRNTYDETGPTIYDISDTFQVKGIGVVLGGNLKKGTIEVDKEYYLGPFGDGKFQKVKVRSIHIKRTSVQKAYPGKYVCINIPKINRKSIYRGMVLLSKPGNESREFYAEVVVYKTHHTTIRIGYETMVHVNAMRQSVKLLEIIKKKKTLLKKSNDVIPTSDSVKDVLSLGDRAIVKFRFKTRPCYLNVNDRILLAETHVKMAGRIVTDL